MTVNRKKMKKQRKTVTRKEMNICTFVQKGPYIIFIKIAYIDKI